ncbi:MAG: dienelactone hydrolase family protein [Rhodobacteraceae bacterium]|nr:dienelactone hydrolase family protein [Paracoccaceae bacterium]MCY4136967.1 dienelactone hydrolase family protein [Paracoccaceae bacterium]
MKFAAHLPVYPSCQVQREKIDMTGRPMLFLVGKEDNDTPAQPSKEYLARIKAAGFPAALNMYTSAGHNIVKVERGYYDELATFNRCGRGTMTLDGHEFMGNASTRNTTWAQFVVAVFHQCGDRGAELYGTKALQRQALSETVNFFTRTLKP